MEKKLTAVEWFLNELQRMQYFIGNDMLQAYNQAIVMEKEQIEDAYVLGKVNSDGVYDVTPDDYYTQTYGK
jgi:hypothetical protein